jgi:hypothetical protein
VRERNGRTLALGAARAATAARDLVDDGLEERHPLGRDVVVGRETLLGGWQLREEVLTKLVLHVGMASEDLEGPCASSRTGQWQCSRVTYTSW